MSQGADGFISHNTCVIENLLELNSSGAAVLRCQISLAAEINGVEREREVLVRVSQLIGCGGGENVDRDLGISAVEGESRPSHRQISSLDSIVLRESLC